MSKAYSDIQYSRGESTMKRNLVSEPKFEGSREAFKPKVPASHRSLDVTALTSVHSGL